jgi:hypothetical protein
MDWALLYTLISDVVTIPLVATGIGGVIGASIGSLWTHYFTQRREREKLLREKAEALILILHQTRHKLFAWAVAIERQAVAPRPSRVERPVAIMLDLDQAEALLHLYFPALRSQFAAMSDALEPYIEWLEIQWDSQERDMESWRAQFRQDEGRPRHDAYIKAFDEMAEAIARAVPQSRRFARALARQR